MNPAPETLHSDCDSGDCGGGDGGAEGGVQIHIEREREEREAVLLVEAKTHGADIKGNIGF